ncbi:MAG TPA: 3-deoxy-D-manno-octulosonic acid transferase [Alphaproteobacteria bacterium]|nr:3-deoxy-D-manno-octulosonic acid transferase [Alphaproteobacteria bacterium]
MLYPIYRCLTGLAGPVVPLILDRRQKAGKEDAERRGERLGRPSMPRPEGRLVWIHGASVGEALSAQALVRRLLDHAPDLSVLLTTGTVTSARLMAGRLPERAVHQYVPVDRLGYARRFLDHWRPDLVLWIESEIWPNLLAEIGRRGIPAAMVNARMSVRSMNRWRRFPGTIARLLGAFYIVLPWDEGEGLKLAELGAPKIGPAGNLKFSSGPPPADSDALAALRGAVGGRKLWLAASTHDGEEAICLDAHLALRAAWPDLLTVLAPRHPARGEAVADLAAARGLRLARRSAGELPSADTEIYLADTLGEMGTFLRATPIVLVGGSLVPHGGHNPVEPAQLGCAILHGPHMTNFAEIAGQLAEAGAAREVADGKELTETLGRLLDDACLRDGMARAAGGVADRNRHVLDAAMAAIVPLLDGRR